MPVERPLPFVSSDVPSIPEGCVVGMDATDVDMAGVLLLLEGRRCFELDLDELLLRWLLRFFFFDEEDDEDFLCDEDVEPAAAAAAAIPWLDR